MLSGGFGSCCSPPYPDEATMKLLNLEPLGPTKRSINFGDGVRHSVVEMSIEDFIAINVAAKALAGSTDVVAQIEAAIDTVIRSVPTVASETLRKLSLAQLGTVNKFLRGEDEEPAAVTDAVADEAGAEPKKP
jgi:hypothetical protein